MNFGAMLLLFGSACILSMGLTWLATPLAAGLARRFKVLDLPNHRKAHRTAIPRLGGVAVFAGIMGALPILLLVSPDARELVFPNLRQILYLGAGATLLFVVGLVDDVRGISPRTKVIFQIVAALLAFRGGFQFQLFQGEESGGLLPWALSLSLTVLWTLGTTNAVNLIDGLDGLASGIAGIAMVILACISIGNGHAMTALAALICAGAAMGFLWHNRHPAKIFLGDSGSLLLGFLLSTLSIEGTQQGSLVASLVGPLCLLFLPLLDTVLAMVRRALKGLPVSYPDNHHIHHRLLHRGIAHPKVVAILWAVALAVGMLALLFRFMEGPHKALVTNALAVVLLILTLRHLAGLEVEEGIRSMRNINRRKRTPRAKVLQLRRDLEAAAAQATAGSLLEAFRDMAERLELDAIKVTMTSPSGIDAMTVMHWDRNAITEGYPGDWIPTTAEYSWTAASCLYKPQGAPLAEITLTVEMARASWKDRRRSEDVRLWARMAAEKLATLEHLRMFCPGEAETFDYAGELT